MRETARDRYRFQSRFGPFCLLLAAMAVLPAAGAAQEEEAAEHPGFLAAKGRVTYRVYCANCHGVEGKGNGNVAQFLTVKPTDVTLLSRENDGVFPKERVIQIVDGRKPVRGHGSKEMPIWGDVFQSPLSEQAPTGDEAGEQRARRKIQELVAYLEAIQVGSKAAAAPEGDDR